MDKEITKLENCLKTMRKCLEIPHVENCICFFDAFKVLHFEVNRLQKTEHSLEDKEKFMTIRDEIGKIEKMISSHDKECLGCNPCMTAVVFKAYPDVLKSLYTKNDL